MDFAYCIDCKELSYAITDSNGVFDRNKAASNHFNHRNIIFGTPNDYVLPVRYVRNAKPVYCFRWVARFELMVSVIASAAPLAVRWNFGSKT